MPQLTSSLCFCGAASRAGRRSAILERACLEARLRLQLGAGKQALALCFSAEPRMPEVYRCGAYTLVSLSACPRGCLHRDDILSCMAHGFSRVFLQLSPNIKMIGWQMTLVEEVASGHGSRQAITLFHSGAGLRHLLSEQGDIEPLPPAISEAWPADRQGALSVGEGCTLCGQCDWACPTGAIHLGETGATLEIRDEQCSGCGICASVCSEQAIALHPQQRRAG
ncbi:ATP-binding protein [Phaeobacter sp. HF9A]|uniref:ATP-binding protein n=1 Tax=Phaeobacter sp. HF9A TaxID=2721561 RepID=UPI001431CE00|nr:4Fe-4S binding protein [Phaeobacter sp. HF9A]NIZ15059.1 4Fe-4S binding protein [Phaeobacter sp. HF9A]